MQCSCLALAALIQQESCCPFLTLLSDACITKQGIPCSHALLISAFPFENRFLSETMMNRFLSHNDESNTSALLISTAVLCFRRGICKDLQLKSSASHTPATISVLLITTDVLGSYQSAKIDNCRAAQEHHVSTHPTYVCAHRCWHVSHLLPSSKKGSGSVPRSAGSHSRRLGAHLPPCHMKEQNLYHLPGISLPKD